MSNQDIIHTKLFIPSPRPYRVVHQRLIEELKNGIHRKLTLVSAPAGFGKTTLVGEWIAGCELPVTLLSLDEADSDPARFITYLVAALQTIKTGIAEELLAAPLQSPQPPSIESLLTALLNEITSPPSVVCH